MFTHFLSDDDYFAEVKEGTITSKYRIKELKLNNVEKDGIKALLLAKKAYHDIQVKMKEKGFGYQRPNVNKVTSARQRPLKYVEKRLHWGMNIMHQFKQGQPLRKIS